MNHRALLLALATLFVLLAHEAAAQATAPLPLDALETRVRAHPADGDAALDLGITYALDDRLGDAIWAFERAHRAAPFDREISDALADSRREARTRRAEAAGSATLTEGEPPALVWWRLFGNLPPSTVAASLLAALWMLFGALLARRRPSRPAVRDALAVVAVLSGLIAVAAAGGWLGGAWAARTLQPAVVVDDTPRWREAPDEIARQRRHPDLYEGAIVLVRDRRDPWRRVELVDGERVWVHADVLRPIVTNRR